ncbi:MAG TPA: glycosyltransferase family 39 protein, partial [Elusimicrobiales bacterium]|nr:glycosyltransferase family 39 protein [Elusimicrobiales bacterium]
MMLRFNKKNIVIFALLSLNFFTMLFISWRKWADIWIDYGREPYTAWLLSMGKPLYVAVDCLYGPLAHYINAAVFMLVGPGLIFLSCWNILLLVVFSVVVYRFFCHYADSLVAALCVCCFYSVFAFSQYTFMGSLNFVCPYTHSMTYGVMLAVSCCFSLCYYFETNQTKFLLLAGFLCGLVFLTKAEAFVAAFGASILTFCIVIMRDWKRGPCPSQHTIPYHLLVFVLAALAPVLIAVLLMGIQMPFGTAVNGVFSSMRC